MDTPDLSSVAGGISAGQSAIISISAAVIVCGVTVFVIPLASRWALSLFKDVGEVASSPENIPAKDMYQMHRSAGATPAQMQKIPGGWRKL